MCPKTLTFAKGDIDNRIFKNVSSWNLAQSLTTSLLGDLTLNAKVSVLGLGIGLSCPPTLP